MKQQSLKWGQMIRFASKSELFFFHVLTSWTTFALLLAMVLFAMWK